MDTNTCIPSYSSEHLNQLQQQRHDVDLLTKNKNKKCRGNRKKQRYRRQLHKQGLDSETVNKLVNQRFLGQVQQQQQQSHSEQQMISQRYSTQDLQVFIPLERGVYFLNIVTHIIDGEFLTIHFSTS